MITLVPVLERWNVDCPLWPVERGDFLLPVPRVPAAEQTGAVMWALIGLSVTDNDLALTVASATEAIEKYLGRDDDGDYAPGGLRVVAGDVVIDPGCCVGLDEWREWLGLARGEVIDLGHDPDVAAEQCGPVVRIWKDKRTHRGPYIDVPRDTLPGILAGVQQDLAGFLAALHPWACEIDPRLADRLVDDVDRRLRISA